LAADPRDQTLWGAIVRLPRGRLEPGDLNLVVDPASRVVRGLFDAAAAAFVAGFIGARFPLFGFVAWIWFAVAIWRAPPRLVGLLFATLRNPHPCIRRIEESTRARLLRAVRWVVAWQLATLLLHQAFLGVLAADKITQLVDAISGVFGVG